MKECKFCHMTPDGDIPEDRENLFTINVGQLFSCRVLLFGAIWKDELAIFMGINKTECGSEQIKIHYCPMCGRDLTEEK